MPRLQHCGNMNIKQNEAAAAWNCRRKSVHRLLWEKRSFSKLWINCFTKWFAVSKHHMQMTPYICIYYVCGQRCRRSHEQTGKLIRIKTKSFLSVKENQPHWGHWLDFQRCMAIFKLLLAVSIVVCKGRLVIGLERLGVLIQLSIASLS